MSGTVWHDEPERWDRTGHLDEGPCWCEECIAEETGNADAPRNS